MKALIILTTLFASKFALAQACPNGVCPCPSDSVWIVEKGICEQVAERDFLCIGASQATIVKTRGQIRANQAARNLLGVTRFGVECLMLQENVSPSLKSVLTIVE